MSLEEHTVSGKRSKRQRMEQPDAVQVCKNQPSYAAVRLSATTIWIVAFMVLMFLAMTVQTVQMSLLVAAVAILFSIGKTPWTNLRSRAGVPLLGFLAFLILCTAASLYTRFGSYALSELSHFMAAGALALLLVARGRRENTPGLLWGFSSVCAAIGLLCIDCAYKGPLFRTFSAVMASFGSTVYQEMEQATYTGARFDGIFNNANLTGSLMALGILVGLYLIRTGKSWKGRLAASLLTGVSSVAFLTAMSRGAILCFGVTLLVYLVAAGKGERLGLFFTMLSMGITMSIFGVLSIILLGQGAFAGTLIALPSGFLLWGLNELLGRRAAAILAGKVKWVIGSVAALAVIGVAAVIIAFNMTEPFLFTGSNFFVRGADVVSGETYTLSGDGDKIDEINVTVYGSTREQELQGITETYYNGFLTDATFTVPEGISRVLFRFDGSEGACLRSVSLSDGTALPMSYTLLPENIVGRFQKNLFQDNSFLLRVQYVKDGLTLFSQSPLVGHGLGATEGLLTSVQPFFYESLYLHNHILQIMDEMGLLGLAAFLALLLGTIWLLVRQLRKEADPIAAVLLACWVMMNLHGLMEITFSVRMYQCAAFFLLMLVVVQYQKPFFLGTGGRVAGIAAVSATGVWLLVSGGLLLGNQFAQEEYVNLDVSSMTVEQFMSTMERLDWMDCYTDQDYKVNRIANALQQGDEESLALAARCAKQLMADREFDACYKAAAYYYLPLGDLPGFFNAVQTGLAQERSNEDAWNSAFRLYVQAYHQLDESLMGDFVAGIVSTGEQMAQANEVLLVDVALDEQGEALLGLSQALYEQGVDGQAAYTMIGALLQGETETN